MTASAIELWGVAVGAVAPRAELLGADERSRLTALVRPADQQRYQAAHVALRLVLGHRLDRDPARVRIGRAPCPRCNGPHGRPELAEMGPPVHFSLSYARDRILIGLAPRPIGVDIEAATDGEAARAVARMLAPDTRAEVARRPSAEQSGAVLLAWVRSEALLKGRGTGIAVGLDGADVGIGQVPRSPVGWLLLDLIEPAAVPTGFRAALAVTVGRDDSSTDSSGDSRPGWRSWPPA